MNKVLTLVLAIFLLSSCGKEPVSHGPAEPRMRYTDLQNAEVHYGVLQRLDVDHNGTTDFSFSTLLVGDPILKRDRLQFYVDSKVDTHLPVSEGEQVPVLFKGDAVKAQYAGYTWYEISSIVLAEKIMPVTGEPWWNGLWTTAAHRYLPISVKRGGQYYYGWIELSFDTASEKLVLHQAAIADEGGREVRAGY